MKIVNVPTNDILTGEALGWGNEFIMGSRMSRYWASWLNCGGDYNDEKGFVEWMMNIPFKNKDGNISYISEDNAVDTYHIMACGKSELEHYVREYLAEYR